MQSWIHVWQQFYFDAHNLQFYRPNTSHDIVDMCALQYNAHTKQEAILCFECFKWLSNFILTQYIVKDEIQTKICEKADIDSCILLDLGADGDCFFHVLAFQLNRVCQPFFPWTAQKLRIVFYRTLVKHWASVKDYLFSTLGTSPPTWTTFETSKVREKIQAPNAMVPIEVARAVQIPCREYANDFMILTLFSLASQFEQCQLQIVNYNAENDEFIVLSVPDNRSNAKYILRFVHGNSTACCSEKDLNFLKNHYVALLTESEWYGINQQR